MLYFCLQADTDQWEHLSQLADFALAMKDVLQEINTHSFNDFHLRIGLSNLALQLLLYSQMKNPTFRFYSFLLLLLSISLVTVI